MALFYWLNWTVNHSVQAAEDEGGWHTGAWLARGHFNQSCLAEGKISPAVLLPHEAT